MNTALSHYLHFHRRRSARVHADATLAPLPLGRRAQAAGRAAGDSLAPLLRWLVIAAVAAWLIGRTLTRGAHFIPKTSPILEFYQGLTLVGQFAFTLTGVLALVALGWIAWRTRAEMRGVFAILVSILLIASLSFMFLAPSAWVSAAYHLLALSVLGLLAIHAGHTRRFTVCALPLAAVMVGELYLANAALSNALRAQSVLPWSSALYNAGELIVVGAPLALWWVCARHCARVWMYLAAAIPALAFAIAYARSPSLTGIVAMWSLGLSLYLPWVIYALSAWLMGVTLLALWRRGDARMLALWLLIAAGYAPSLSVHMFLALIALWWFAHAELENTNAIVG